jgi:hypothetical protein
MVTHTGIPLATFLDVNSPDLASQLVVAKATDGYQVVFSLSELLLPNGTANLRRASGGPAGASQLGNFLDVRDRCARAGRLG